MRKKVLLVGPILTQSGYGEHARTVYRALKSREDLFDIFVKPINWGSTSWVSEDTDERNHIDFLINKTFFYMSQKMPFDTTIMVTIPSEWKQYRFAPENIGVCAGIETDRVSPHWLESSNLYVDKIIVPSEFAKEGFLNSIWNVKDTQNNDVELKLNKPVEVVHYPIEEEFMSPSNCLHESLDFKHDFNFLCVAQWGPRKNIEATISYFLNEFKNDEVGLILKTSIKDGSTIDFYETKSRILNILARYPERKCSVHLLHGYFTKEELSSVYTHPKIKVMINFGHGEGYGLPLFEAASVGLPIITHDWGGQKDFLYAERKDKKGKVKLKPHFSRVAYDLKEVQKEAVWDSVIQPESKWAFPNEGACKIAMRQAYENYGLCSGHAKRLKKWLKNTFTSDKINKEIVSIIGAHSSEEEEWLNNLSQVDII